jgi:thiamine pyrophosphokinase
VLAGRDLAPRTLEAWLSWADYVVAADGGADLCREAGREPDKIVGDLDSISDRRGLSADPDQDSSDADKLLAFLKREGIESATLIGVEGDRLDHVIATLYSVARVPQVSCRIVLRMGVVFVVRGPSEVERGSYNIVSLLPLGTARVTLSGVRWPLENAVLDPLGLVSLSNAGDPRLDVFLQVHEGVVALFLSD